MTLHASQDDSLRRRRVHHAKRTAQSHAAFLLPHLEPGMALLDLGCGPGSITVGLAAAVAPGPVTAVDLDPTPIEGVSVIEVASLLREGTSPRVGRQLRQLLVDAGFNRPEASARALYHGTDTEVRQVTAFTASLYQYPSTVDRVVAERWATAAELDEMSRAWTAWAETPGAFLARFWCEALAWAD